jgi:hypothetical protein
LPLPSPVKTTWPAVASTPPIIGCGVFTRQRIFGVVSTAVMLAIAWESLKAPPSQSLPPG